MNDNVKRNGIYTTGAYLVPRKMEEGWWCWIVAGFEDDSFEVGTGTLVLPNDEWAKSIDDLIYVEEE